MSTFLAILSGCALFFIAIIGQGGISVFLDLSSFMITIGGTVTATFISFPLPRVLRVLGVLTNAFRRDFKNPSSVIGTVVRLAVKARQQSLLALDEEAAKTSNRFLRLGLQLVVDGHPPELIREVLTTEQQTLQVRHLSGEQIFRTAGKYAPAFGLIGTLIGLIAMLRNLGSGGVDKMGPAMAVALVTTFYGALLTNLVLFPLAEKLRSRTNEELLQVSIITEGVLMLQAGINPRLVETKLNAFLPPEVRASHVHKYQTREQDDW